MGVNRDYTRDVLSSWWISFLLVLILNEFIIVTVAEDYCPNEPFEAQCNDSQVILMERADIGRMRANNKCFTGTTYIGCYTVVLPLMDQRCSGRRSCSVPFRDVEGFSSNCVTDYKVYIEAEYSCIDIHDPPQNHTGPIQLHSDTGFLSSISFYERQLGTKENPWTFTVQPGQTIEVILYDFKIGESLSLLPQSTPCPAAFKAIEDDGEVNSVSICNIVNTGRENTVYTSQGHKLTFYLDINGSFPQENYFLLKYQVLGCADIEPPKGAYAVRDTEGDTVTVRCNATGETWYLVCKDTGWLGELSNCSEAEGPGQDGNQPDEGFPWGIVIAVVIGIGVGCVVGGLMLCILFLCRKCIKNRKREKERREAGRDLSNIEIPTVAGKQMGDQQVNPAREGIYSRGPGLGTVPGMANHIAHAHSQAHTMHGPTYGTRAVGVYGTGWDGRGAAFPRHGSLPRDAARLHQQGTLHRPLTRRLSSEEHIYEKTPYDAYSLASGSQAGSIGKHQGMLVNPSPSNAMPSPSGTASTNLTFDMAAMENAKKF